jgi:hypothetical protein
MSDTFCMPRGSMRGARYPPTPWRPPCEGGDVDGRIAIPHSAKPRHTSPKHRAKPDDTPVNHAPVRRLPPIVANIRRAIAAFGTFARAIGVGCVPCSARRPFSRKALISRHNPRPAGLFQGRFFQFPAYFPASQGNDGPAEMSRVMPRCDEKWEVDADAV